MESNLRSPLSFHLTPQIPLLTTYNLCTWRSIDTM